MNEQNIPIIDAHHHFWDLDKNYYPFLADHYEENFFLGDYSNLKKNYLPENYRKDTINHNIIGSIHCEAEWDRLDQVGETKWLKSIKDKYNLPTAVVAHAWFHTKNAEKVIEKQASFKFVKGIRSKPIVKNKESDSYDNYVGTMQDQKWRDGLKLLEKYNLNYDLRIPSWHLIESLQVIRLIPNVKVIINHAGFPWDRSKDGILKWKNSLKILANEGNVYIKLSEFGVKNQDWNYEENRRIILDIIDIFSPSRCMFASNFPVSSLKISFDDLYNNYNKIVKNLTKKIHQKNDTFVHRDFHISNLMMVKNGIGVIDSQDALIGNKAYDLASLIDDVRFETSVELKKKIYNFYLKTQKKLNKKSFKNDFEIISVLRNLKIIGIFTRLAVRDNKKKYLKLIPYAWKLIKLRSQSDNFKDLNNLLKVLKKNK